MDIVATYRSDTGSLVQIGRVCECLEHTRTRLSTAESGCEWTCRWYTSNWASSENINATDDTKAIFVIIHSVWLSIWWGHGKPDGTRLIISSHFHSGETTNLPDECRLNEQLSFEWRRVGSSKVSKRIMLMWICNHRYDYHLPTNVLLEHAVQWRPAKSCIIIFQADTRCLISKLCSYPVECSATLAETTRLRRQACSISPDHTLNDDSAVVSYSLKI